MRSKLGRYPIQLSVLQHASFLSVFIGRRQLIPVGGGFTLKVAHEKVHQLQLAIATTGAMTASGNYEQIELFVGLDQPIDNLIVDAGSTFLSISPTTSMSLALQPPCIVDV